MYYVQCPDIIENALQIFSCAILSYYHLVMTPVDIAVLVFNKCTTNNVGSTKTLSHGTEEVVTKDSPHFEVTFDYEFLEDFQEKNVQRLQTRHLNGKAYNYHSESGYTASGGATHSTDGVDQSTTDFQDTRENNWGPAGFEKSNHPLNIMVSFAWA